MTTFTPKAWHEMTPTTAAAAAAAPTSTTAAVITADPTVRRGFADHDAALLCDGERPSLLDLALAETDLLPGEDGYTLLRRGLAALIAQSLHTDCAEPRLDRFAVDAMIAIIDARLSAQLDEILHHPSFQALESAWRSLKFLIDRVDFRENIKIDVLSAPKDVLRDDLDDAGDVSKSGLFQVVYSNEYGVLGGEPYGLLCTTFAFGPSSDDIDLLRRVTAVAAMAHAPLITNADSRFFGQSSLADLPKLRDLQALFEGPQYAAWRAFRSTDDARYVGLCLPRFLLRSPYTERNTRNCSFAYNETTVGNADAFLWGPASVALTSRIADSFARYRWCPNIIGPRSGGTVDGLALPFESAMNPFQSSIPTEVLLTERREFELAGLGFIGMAHRKGTTSACFFSANSAQQPRRFIDDEAGQQAAASDSLGTQLPYMFIITRLSHYIKVLQREHIGSWKERTDLERELNRWISQYVTDMDDPAPGVRSRRPLRRARIRVDNVDTEPGWYRCAIEVQPHLKYMGASFTLSLVGRLEKF